MASTIANLAVSLTANSSGFSKGMRGARKDVLGLQSAVASAKRTIIGLAGAYVSMRGVQNALAAWGVQEKAVTELSASLESIGQNSPDAVKRLEQFASTIQSVSTYGDEAVLSVAALGARLGKWSGRDLEVATTAAAGLAKALNVDLESGMRLIVRAGAGSTEMLSRYGLTLSSSMSQQEKFNAVLEFGLKNFKLAEAEANTYAGRMQQMRNAVGDASEVMGSILAPAVTRVAKLITEYAVPSATMFATVVKNWRAIVLSVSADIIGVFAKMVDAIGTLTGAWSGSTELIATLFANMAESVKFTFYAMMAEINAIIDGIAQRASAIMTGVSDASKYTSIGGKAVAIVSGLAGAALGTPDPNKESATTKAYRKLAEESASKLFPGGELSSGAQSALSAMKNPFKEQMEKLLAGAMASVAASFALPGVGDAIAMPDIAGDAKKRARGSARSSIVGAGSPLTSNYLTRVPGSADPSRIIAETNKQQLAEAKQLNKYMRELVDATKPVEGV